VAKDVRAFGLIGSSQTTAGDSVSRLDLGWISFLRSAIISRIRKRRCRRTRRRARGRRGCARWRRDRGVGEGARGRGDFETVTELLPRLESEVDRAGRALIEKSGPGRTS